MQEDLKNTKRSDWNTVMKNKIFNGIRLNKMIVDWAADFNPVCILTGEYGLFDGNEFRCRLILTKTVQDLEKFFKILNPLVSATTLNVEISQYLHSMYSITFQDRSPGEKAYFYYL